MANEVSSAALKARMKRQYQKRPAPEPEPPPSPVSPQEQIAELERTLVSLRRLLSGAERRVEMLGGIVATFEKLLADEQGKASQWLPEPYTTTKEVSDVATDA